MIALLIIATLGGSLEFEETCDPGEPWSCIQPLRKGEAAPFEGQLYTFRKAAKQAVKAGGCPKRIEKAVRLQKDLDLKDLNSLEALLKIERRYSDREVDFLNKQISTSATPWYKEPVFVAGTTAVVMTAVFAILGGM